MKNSVGMLASLAAAFLFLRKMTGSQTQEVPRSPEAIGPAPSPSPRPQRSSGSSWPCCPRESCGSGPGQGRGPCAGGRR
eukprot:11936057-Alexandrium_andersonii.AAC.1